MRIPLDREGGAPLYRQIADHLRQGIVRGSLEPGLRLPATRRLAGDLGVNRITVETAYAELQAEGLVASRLGSGTYVLPPLPQTSLPSGSPAAPWPLWQQELERARPISTEVLRDEVSAGAGSPRTTGASRLTRALGVPGPAQGQGAPGSRQAAAPGSHGAALIDLASGRGDPALFPIDDFRRMLQAVLHRDGVAALDYGEHRGYAPPREVIAHILASQGLPARAENVLITAGSQQVLALVAQLLLRPGDAVIVESPTYGGALDLFRMLDLKVIGVGTDAHGLQVETLEPSLQRHHPKLIYTIPNFHNPTGSCLDGQRRRRLIELAERYNVPLLEDDFVGDLRYDGRAQPALKALDPGGRVIYASTFSKMLMPGLRVGFLLADGPVYQRLVECKRVNDLATSNLLQRALEAYVTVGRYQTHLRRACRRYRRRRDAMLQAIQRHLPRGVRLDPPLGGLFVWLRLPPGMDSGRLLAAARREGVSFAPGRRFFPGGKEGASHLRLNFAAQTEAEITEGVKRLGEAMRKDARRRTGKA